MKLAKEIARIKIYFDRSRMYFSYMQFILILALFIQGYESDFVKEHLKLILILAIPVMIACFVFIGWLDEKAGIRKREIENITKINPVITELMKRLENIEKILKNVK